MEDVPHLSENPDKQSRNETRLQCLENDVKKLEDYLRDEIFDEDKQVLLLENVTNNIEHEDEDQRTSLRALGYLPDRNNDILPSLMVIDTTEAYWRGANIYRVKDADRVLAQYEVIEDGHIVPYYVPPLAILCNERYGDSGNTGRTHPALQIIANNADRAMEKVICSRFFHVDGLSQRAILDDISKDLHDQLQVEYDADVPVTIETSEYYQIPKDTDISTVDWNQYRRTAAGTADEPYFLLSGSIRSAVYLEALRREPSKMTSTNDLSIGHGLPCIALADQARQDVSYYIPSASTVSFYSEADNTA